MTIRLFYIKKCSADEDHMFECIKICIEIIDETVTEQHINATVLLLRE